MLKIASEHMNRIRMTPFSTSEPWRMASSCVDIGQCVYWHNLDGYELAFLGQRIHRLGSGGTQKQNA